MACSGLTITSRLPRKVLAHSRDLRASKASPIEKVPDLFIVHLQGEGKIVALDNGASHHREFSREIAVSPAAGRFPLWCFNDYFMRQKILEQSWLF